MQSEKGSTYSQKYLAYGQIEDRTLYCCRSLGLHRRKYKPNWKKTYTGIFLKNLGSALISAKWGTNQGGEKKPQNQKGTTYSKVHKFKDTWGQVLVEKTMKHFF